MRRQSRVIRHESWSDGLAFGSNRGKRCAAAVDLLSHKLRRT